ncbi:hypothetical protein ACSBR2_004468 [Camellia fascicularis]
MPTTNELGLLIRRLCPLKGVKSWKKIDQSIKDVVVQAVLDTFEIGEDFHTDQQAQEIVDTKAYLLYKDWRYTLKQHFKKLVKEGVDDPYSHPPTGVCLDDWKHMIDVAWKDDSHLEELSRQVLGQRKNYLRRFGIGPQPYSPSDSAARSRDKQMEAMRYEMEVLHENLMKEKEERQRDREEMMREREELMKEVEEGKKSKAGATRTTESFELYGFTTLNTVGGFRRSSSYLVERAYHSTRYAILTLNASITDLLELD